jgi:hypothetical protein
MLDSLRCPHCRSEQIEQYSVLKQSTMGAETSISALNLYGSIPRSLLRSLVTQYPAACCGVDYCGKRFPFPGAVGGRKGYYGNGDLTLRRTRHHGRCNRPS